MSSDIEKYDEWDPEASIQLLKIPSVPNYAGLRKLIENSSSAWLEEFLGRDGLGVLFNRLEKLSGGESGGSSSSISNALLLLEVTYAVRAVANSKVGLEYLLAQRQFTRQLINGLLWNFVFIQFDIFTLLSSICILHYYYRVRRQS